MKNSSQNSKRIAKNTLLLYFRMILLLCVNLYTSRVVLAALGIEDYGIYNVVGGVVTMFAFLNNAMAGATQRFLNFDLAKNDEKALSHTFCTAVIVHIFIAVIIVLLAETVGLWFLYEKMVIPNNRIGSALCVFQCSVLVMLVNVISVPYNAAIIAHEKMGAFAYISILEASLKLLIVFLLCVLPYDKLETYAILLLIVSLVIRFIYTSYSHRHFKETIFKFVWDKERITKMGAFAGWSLIGNLALMGVTQGLNMLLNVFFGPVVNAARGVAVQVQGAIQQFVANFQTAVNPQITKSYASGDATYMHQLVCNGSRLSFFMIWFLSLPFLIMTEQVLGLWLKTPPDHSALFLRIVLLNAMIDCLSNPLNNAVGASGRIKTFQLTNSVMMLCVVPIAYIALLYKCNPELAFITQMGMTGITHFVKLAFTHKRIGLPIWQYARTVYIPVIKTVLTSVWLPLLLYYYLNHDIWTFLTTGIICIVSVSVSIFFLGLRKEEQSVIKSKIHTYLNKSK